MGAYYFRNDARYDPLDLFLFPAITGAAGVINSRQFGRQVTQSFAGYAQATVPLGEQTNVTAGIRYTYDRRRATNTTQTVLGFAPSPPATVFPVRRNSVGKPTWRLSIDHRLSAEVLIYASYNRGIKSGTFPLTDPTAAALRSEQIDAFEGGAKIEALDRRLRLNVAAFLTNSKDVQLQRISNGVVQYLNAAAARAYGVDAEATFVPIDRLTLGAGIELLHSEYTAFPNAPMTMPNRNPVTRAAVGGNTITVFDATGRQTILTPNATYNLSASYRTPLASGELGLSASYYWNAGWYPEVDNRTMQPSYHLLNGQISWSPRNERFLIRVWGRNLTNAKVAAQISEQQLGDVQTTTEPRTYGVALDVKF